MFDPQTQQSVLHHVLSASFWWEVGIHIVAFCSAASCALTPFEEWAKDNLSEKSYKRIHAGVELLSKYGALNNRKQKRDIWDDAERQKQLGGQTNAAVAGK